MAAISSFGSTGFGTNILNPADKALVRSSTRTYAVSATAGVYLRFSIALSLRISEYPSSPGIAKSDTTTSGLGVTRRSGGRCQLVNGSTVTGALLFCAALTIRGSVAELEEVTRLAMKHVAHLLQGLEIDSERFAFLKTPKRRVADSRFLSQPVEGPALRLQ